MTMLRTLRFAGVGLLLLLGCGDADPPQPRTNPFLGDGGVAAFQITEEFEIDLTEDGAPELIVVSVDGDDVRDLDIELTITRPGGDLLYGSAWNSGEYPALRSADRISEWQAGEVVRNHLGQLLDDDSIHPLEEADIDPELAPAASLIGRRALSYQAGDSFRTLVWSPELDRFLIVRSCC